MTVVGVDLENVLRMAISELTNAGVEGAIIDSRILASAAFDLSREEILREPDATLKISDIALFKEIALIERPEILFWMRPAYRL